MCVVCMRFMLFKLSVENSPGSTKTTILSSSSFDKPHKTREFNKLEENFIDLLLLYCVRMRFLVCVLCAKDKRGQFHLLTRILFTS